MGAVSGAPLELAEEGEGAPLDGGVLDLPGDAERFPQARSGFLPLIHHHQGPTAQLERPGLQLPGSRASRCLELRVQDSQRCLGLTPGDLDPGQTVLHVHGIAPSHPRIAPLRELLPDGLQVEEGPLMVAVGQQVSRQVDLGVGVELRRVGYEVALDHLRGDLAGAAVVLAGPCVTADLRQAPAQGVLQPRLHRGISSPFALMHGLAKDRQCAPVLSDGSQGQSQHPHGQGRLQAVLFGVGQGALQDRNGTPRFPAVLEREARVATGQEDRLRVPGLLGDLRRPLVALLPRRVVEVSLDAGLKTLCAERHRLRGPGAVGVGHLEASAPGQTTALVVVGPQQTVGGPRQVARAPLAVARQLGGAQVGLPRMAEGAHDVQNSPQPLLEIHALLPASAETVGDLEGLPVVLAPPPGWRRREPPCRRRARDSGGRAPSPHRG